MILKTLKKLFLSRITDSQVDAINAESESILDVASQKTQSQIDLLKKNGVTLRIFIATGGDHHEH